MCYHGLDYCLGKNLKDRDNNNCPSCNILFYVCSRIEQLVTDTSNTCVDEYQRENAKQIRRDTAQKFALYMAHAF